MVRNPQQIFNFFINLYAYIRNNEEKELLEL